MKTLTYFMFAFTLMFFTYSCDEAKKADIGGDPINPTVIDLVDSTNDLISKGAFDTMRTNWRNNFRAYMAADSLHYFEVPTKDLKAILNEPGGVDDTRFYLGMDASGRKPHLMVVGLKNHVIDTSVIADYTKACPIICPPPKI